MAMDGYGDASIDMIMNIYTVISVCVFLQFPIYIYIDIV